MKIKLMNIADYGCLKQKEIAFGDGISVIKGNNESGKSTTHQAILALMFGFVNDGSKKAFKLTKKAESFSGGLPRITGKLASSTDEITVSRYFEGSIPKSSIDKIGVIKVYDNQELDILKGMSRETYEGIYSLDIDKIASLKQSWEREQDSILAGLYPAFLLSNDRIEENLDKKIKEVWKGKTNAGKARELEAALSQKKIGLRNALVQQQELRRLEMEEEQTQHEIVSCEKEIDENEKKIIELKRQHDFFEEYAEIKNATAENAMVKEYEYLPKDIKMHIENIEEEIRQKSKEKQEKSNRAKELQEVIDHYRSEEPSINTLKELVPEAEKINLELGAINSGIARSIERETAKQNQIEAKTKRIFTNQFKWSDFEKIMKIDIADCLTYIETLQTLNEQKAIVSRKALDEKERGHSSKFGRVLPIILAAFAGLAGAAMMFFDFGLPRNISVYVGVGLLASAALAAAIIGTRAHKGAAAGTNLAELKQLEKEYDAALMKLQDRIKFDFIPAEKRKNPDKVLIESIAQIQDDYTEYVNLEEETQEGKKSALRAQEAIEKIMISALGQGARRETAAEDMRRKLNDLLELESDAKAAIREIESVKKQLAEIEQFIKIKENFRQKTADALQVFEGGSILQKAQTLQEMRERLYSAVGRARVLKQKYDDFEALEKSGGGSPHIKIYDIKSSVEVLSEKLKVLRNEKSTQDTKKGELTSRIEILKQSGDSPAVIEGEIDDLRQEIKNRIKQRDQYVLCHSIIHKAREKFVSEFSPDFMDKASEYLSVITDGRYQKIRLGEKGTSIMVMQGSSMVFDFDTIDSNISRGTKEQIYLALRLAMLDRFDPAGSRLPVILDEALVNWDADRFKKLMKIMNEISKQRQIFMFTCHDYAYNIVKQASEKCVLINI